MDLVYCKISCIDIDNIDTRLIKNCSSPTPFSSHQYDISLAHGGRDCQNCHSCLHSTTNEKLSQNSEATMLLPESLLILRKHGRIFPVPNHHQCSAARAPAFLGSGCLHLSRQAAVASVVLRGESSLHLRALSPDHNLDGDVRCLAYQVTDGHNAQTSRVKQRRRALESHLEVLVVM